MQFVLDASAVLAWLKRETGWEKISAVMDETFVVSTANYCEVVTKLVDEKVPREDIDLMLEEFAAELVPVNRDIADLAGHLRGVTRDRGLSLGDRLCLATALGLSKAGPVTTITADRSWAQLKLAGVQIALIR